MPCNVYLANGLFSEAERSFNVSIAAALRQRGMTVFLPQETVANHKIRPDPMEVFSSDYAAIRASNVLLAVIDGDVPDTGVSCEIGLARAHGIPIVGLWTDVRQERVGEGRPMLNIFLVGAVRQNGTLCKTVADAVNACWSTVNAVSEGERTRAVLDHYAVNRELLTEVFDWLPNAYIPPLDPGAEIVSELSCCTEIPRVVLDVGAGDGWLGAVLKSTWAKVQYFPYDPAYGFNQLPASADTAIFSFVLHDVAQQKKFVAEFAERLPAGGNVIIFDLSPADLPRLREHLESSESLSPELDRRIGPERVLELTNETPMSIASLRFIVRDFVFANRSQLESYLAAFGVDKGFDFPWLPLAKHRKLLNQSLAQLEFPFRDKRVFTLCRLTKLSTSR